MTTDVRLNNAQGFYDICWLETGDMETDDTLDTAILVSLFEEKRATKSEFPANERRRGWLGNDTTPTFEQGSKIWEFEQERVTGTTLAELGVVIRNSLQWLIADKIAISIVVDDPILRDGKVTANITYTRSGGKIDTRFFTLWNNSGDFQGEPCAVSKPIVEVYFLNTESGDMIVTEFGDMIVV